MADVSLKGEPILAERALPSLPTYLRVRAAARFFPEGPRCRYAVLQSLKVAHSLCPNVDNWQRLVAACPMRANGASGIARVSREDYPQPEGGPGLWLIPRRSKGMSSW